MVTWKGKKIRLRIIILNIAVSVLLAGCLEDGEKMTTSNASEGVQSLEIKQQSQSPESSPIEFGLKAGFYNGDDPNTAKLWTLIDQADFRIDLSWHNGISSGGEDGLTLAQVKGRVIETEGRRMAHIVMAKNYIEESLHVEIERLLFTEGFEYVLMTTAHSQGVYLNSLIRKKTLMD